MYDTYGPVRFVSIISYTDWHATEIIAQAANVAPVVNADDQMLQMLTAGGGRKGKTSRRGV